VAQRLGVEYAYPTQTLYMKQAENALLSPEEDVFSPDQSEADAQALGREQAKSIVAATTGVGVVPPPVDPS
jgi:MscS family membrane protein